MKSILARNSLDALDWKRLAAFDAVARHRNFTRAARELNVQQPAISRRVAELETDLGVRLLRRTRPDATLTQEGEVLHRAIVAASLQVRDAVKQIQRHRDRHLVTINTTIGFASCYLMQRLAAFRVENPDISVELVSRDQNEIYGLAKADIVIAFDRPDRLPGVQQTKIFNETLVPAAKPHLVPELSDDPETLAHHPLLHLSSGIHMDDWTTFFDGTGVMPPAPTSEQKFTSFMVCLQAALNGDGVMLGWEHLMQNYFDLGLLVRVGKRKITTDRGYYACLTERSRDRESVRRICGWLGSIADDK
ncbi:LysR family transcriptional regulator [Loktanella sp. IMCC34160]|uniref:LysR substrate-binding domain-containing protein n=1 Tax=Loktanella sp. IMCC34160 TaxID=2510646 RepID=UPI00101DE252|nr:LysR substrate-binding domain-containing protein [Loktanella sp. IMCC34160]RYG89189.1 LysR family transcriptional regulator [Loktanella sp. IMCC34160]